MIVIDAARHSRQIAAKQNAVRHPFSTHTNRSSWKYWIDAPRPAVM
jgi:hypothetical protein